MTFKPLVAALAACCLVSAHAPAADVAAQATATGIVSGQVTDATTGRPIGGAVVTLSAVAAANQPPIPAAQARRGVAVANASGRFVFRDVPAGTYTLASTRNNYAPGATGRRRPGGPTATFTLDDGGRVTDAVIAMWRLASVSGVVRDDRGEPAIGVGVWAMRRVMTGGRPELTFTGGSVDATDDRGQFRLNGLMPGSYVVAIRTSTQSNSRPSAAAALAARRGPGLPNTGSPFAGSTREGMESGALRIEGTGLVIDGWQVTVSSGMPQPLPGPGATLLVHPATFHANARTPGDATVVTLAAGDDLRGVDVTLPLVAGVRVSGILRGPTGPAAGHGVRLVPAAGPNPTDPIFDIPAAYATTDAAGRFTLLGVPPGAYSLRAFRVPQLGNMMRAMMGEQAAPSTGPPAPSFFAEVPISVGPADVNDVSVVLEPGARLSGRVVFEGAKPAPPAAQISRIALTIRPVTGTVQGGEARVDDTGSFETAGHPPGRYLIAVTSPGPDWTLASVRVAGVDAAGDAFALGSSHVNDVVVTFTDKVTTLSGTVRAEDTSGDPEATVVVMPADVRAWMASGMSPLRVATTAASASGTYQVSIPLPGDYLVVAVPPDVVPEVDPDFVARFASAAVRVSIAAGETRTQALTVRRPR